MTTTIDSHMPDDSHDLPDDPQGRVSDDRFEEIWNPPPGIIGWLSTVQNGNLGLRFISTAFLFFILGGLASFVMRLQLAVPENDLIPPEAYNQLFTMHGSTMMFLFLIPLMEGIATLVLPQMLGSRELPFPRLTSFAFWAFFFGGLIFYASFFFSAVPSNGWFAYVPLSSEQYSPGKGMDFWLLGLNVAEIGAIAGAFEIVLAFFKMRGPGMTLKRVPIFAWAMVVMAFMMIFAFTPLIIGSFMMEFDRKFGTLFYDPQAGGDPLLWQHIFWIFGHPDVYIQFIPATGVISTIIPVMAGRKLIGRNLIILSLIGLGFLSFGLWVHHMFATGLPEVTLALFSAASVLIAIPSGVQMFAWIMTLWAGKKPEWTPQALFTVGFLITFLMGGLTGVMVGVAPFDLQVHDTYFVVAHFHYVLIGGVLFPVFAGLYFWGPKYMEKSFSHRLGIINFWLVFLGFHIAFFPMHISGLLGMPRRVYSYQAETGWGIYNFISTVGVFILTAGIIVFIINYIWAMRQKETPPANPWNAPTLDWATDTPNRQYGFRRLPITHSSTPLWDQESLNEGPEDLKKLLTALEDWPIKWRAQLATSVLDAEPQEIFRVAGPSIWPPVMATAMMGTTLALIYDRNVLLLIAAGFTALSLFMWHYEDYADVTRNTDRDEEFEREHNIPIRASGSWSVTMWAMSLTVLTLGIALMTAIFSYYYLRLDALTWPPVGIPNPRGVIGIAFTIFSLLTVIPAWYASRRGFMQGNMRAITIGVGGALALGVAAIATLGYDMFTVPFTYQTHAYGSLYYLIVGIQGGTIFGGVFMNAIELYRIWQNDTPADQRHSAKVIALYWYYVAGSSLLVAITLYLMPYVF